MVKLFSVGRRETHPTLGTWVGKVVLILEDDPGISCGYNKSHDFGFFFFFLLEIPIRKPLCSLYSFLLYVIELYKNQQSLKYHDAEPNACHLGWMDTRKERSFVGSYLRCF